MVEARRVAAEAKAKERAEAADFETMVASIEKAMCEEDAMEDLFDSDSD